MRTATVLQLGPDRNEALQEAADIFNARIRSVREPSDMKAALATLFRVVFSNITAAGDEPTMHFNLHLVGDVYNRVPVLLYPRVRIVMLTPFAVKVDAQTRGANVRYMRAPFEWLTAAEPSITDYNSTAFKNDVLPPVLRMTDMTQFEGRLAITPNATALLPAYQPTTM